MKKRFGAVLAVVLLAASLFGCAKAADTGGGGAAGATAASGDDFKVGVIYIGDENEGYTESHMRGIDDMQKELGLSDAQVIEKMNIPEDETCYDAAVDLAEQGCKVIFGTSFGHEDHLIRAAREYPDIQFFHATGYQAASSGLSNMHNYFDSIYEARYVSGVVAGMKLNQMIEEGKIDAQKAKIGYVGAYPYAEVVSGFTAFYLGARSECGSATMEVKYTNSWADMAQENETAKQLIADGCVLIGQHADTTGAPSACEAEGVPCVGYNVDMNSVAPNTALTSSTNKWGGFYVEAVRTVKEGGSMPTDWCKGYDVDAVGITALNEAVVAPGTAEKVEETIAAIKAGTLHVFDTSTFTVGGKTLEEQIAAGGDYAQYKDAVSDGYFHESEAVSAPSFAIIIDGVDAQE